MKIGIDAVQANKSNRSGVEWVAWYVIDSLKKTARNELVVLYTREKLKSDMLPLPEMWKSSVLRWPRIPLWTQIRLSLQLAQDKPDVFFSPGYTLPLWHPKKSVAMIHDLGFVHAPELYSWWQRIFYRFILAYTLKTASHIITPTEFTKQDILARFNISESAISVVPLGVRLKTEYKSLNKEAEKPYILYLARLTAKKNVFGVVKAYKNLREKKGVTHKLILAGKPDVGWKKVEKYIAENSLTEHITVTGYVSEEEKWALLKNASVFVFPSFFEGFGIPVIEAMVAGTPVVTSNTTCLPEIVGDSALLVDPKDTNAIVENVYRVLTDTELSKDLIKKGLVQAEKFDWKNTGAGVLKVLNLQ